MYHLDTSRHHRAGPRRLRGLTTRNVGRFKTLGASQGSVWVGRVAPRAPLRLIPDPGAHGVRPPGARGSRHIVVVACLLSMSILSGCQHLPTSTSDGKRQVSPQVWE